MQRIMAVGRSEVIGVRVTDERKVVDGLSSHPGARSIETKNFREPGQQSHYRGGRPSGCAR